METLQVVLILLFTTFFSYEAYTFDIGFSYPVIVGLVMGLIMGDVSMGLFFGGTFQLLFMGVYQFGGASIPDYRIVVILGVYYAVTTGQDPEILLSITVTLAVLYTQIGTLVNFINNIFVHIGHKALKEGKWRKFELSAFGGVLPIGLNRTIVVFLAIVFGTGFVEGLVGIFPAWLQAGLGVAGKLIPAVGVVILMRTMPLKDYFAYFLIGFVLFAYLGVPMLGVAIVGAALAIISYKINLKLENNGVSLTGGDSYDE